MSLSQTKTQLAEAIDLYEHLESELSNKSNLKSCSEEDWQARLRNLGLETAKLIQTGRTLDDDHLINILKRKQKKLARHSSWKKRNKKRAHQKRKQLVKRNEKWIRDTEWQVTVSPSKALKTDCNKDMETEKDIDKEARYEASKLKSKVKELSRILSKLTHLRNLRRKKLEAKGHLFADDGNQFFNQVKEWHDLDQIQSQQHKDMENDYELMNVEQQPSKKLTINKEDIWKHMPIDKHAYKYWCESDQSLEGLLKNRRLWDQYIHCDNDDNDMIHKVPPIFVSPAPPANWIWATYLLK